MTLHTALAPGAPSPDPANAAEDPDLPVADRAAGHGEAVPTAIGVVPGAGPLLERALAPFAPLAETFASLEKAADAVSTVGGRSVSGQARRLKRTLRRAEPSVTLIGQVKAGKTSLLNAMVGAPDLLPADVNPWTSVVTSLHLGANPAPEGAQAVFRFFEADQWERLMQKGGRIGELAGRAGADEELAKVSAQIEAMRKKSKRRLGSQFELLMGQEHRYGHVDPDLIQRYVCLGDDIDGDGESGPEQGRFADITRAADLYLERPEFPVGLCLRDTPGVNDTFLMREQITIQAIRESRICVVVLSAHQALSTVDLALIRLISNLPSRDVVIFVNRIDELADPAADVGEIKESIRQTIDTHRGPTEAEIVFGSANWALHALTGTLDRLDPQSVEALVSWAEAECGDLPKDADGAFDPQAVWDLSGVPDLYRALADRVAETVGAEVADDVGRAGLNLVSQIQTVRRVRPRAIGGAARAPLDRATLLPEIDGIEARLAERLGGEFDRLTASLHERLGRAQAGFVDRAVAALARHLETEADSKAWTYDPGGLRILLRSAFTVYAARARSVTQEVYTEAASEVCGLYVRGFDVDPASFALAPPAPPQIAPPVFLGETIALDLDGGWWSRWWQRRRGTHARAARMADLIATECARMVDAVKAEYGAPDRDRALEGLRGFIGAQRKTLVDLWMRDEVRPEDVAARVAGPEDAERTAALDRARQTFARNVSDTPATSEAA